MINDCDFINNVATEGKPGRGGMPGAHDKSGYGGLGSVYTFGQVAGGAIWSDASESSIELVNCRFVGNRAYEAEYYDYYNYGVLSNDEPELIELYTMGGAIYADHNTDMTLRGCDFVDNLGGALFSGAASDISIYDCLFAGNMGLSNSDSLEKGSYEAGDDSYNPFTYYYGYLYPTTEESTGGMATPAGAVDVGPFGSLYVKDSDFRDNFTSDHGGAVNTRSDVDFDTCSFSGNGAGGNGGAVHVFENLDPNIVDPNYVQAAEITTLSLTMDTCSFSGNRAFAGGIHASSTIGGGGLYADHFIGSLRDCYFLGNTAMNGGGLALVAGTADIFGGAISNNSASANYGIGGGLASMNTDIVVANCMIQNNKATGDNSGGAGVAFYSGGAVNSVMQNCLVTGNESAGEGGGVYCSAGVINAEIRGSTFSENTADQYGGAIACDWSSGISVINSIFNDCGKYAISEEDIAGEDVGGEYLGGVSVKNSLFNNSGIADYALYDSMTS